jgi:hypothetical protein
MSPLCEHPNPAECPNHGTPQRWPEVVSHEEMQRKFTPGAVLTKSAVLVLLGSPEGGRMYRREEEGWVLSDDKPWRPHAEV